MKKIVLALGLCGVLNFAHASSITLDNGTDIIGTYAYEYLINTISLAANQSITAASLAFNNITLTATGNGDDISYDIINRNDATTVITDNDTPGDYFVQTYPTKTTNLGQKNFTLGQNQTWSYTFTTGTLATLNTYLTDGQGLDIGIDPDCHYTVGSIIFSYTVTTTPNTRAPDAASTVMLLGAALTGLGLLRRKLS